MRHNIAFHKAKRYNEVMSGKQTIVNDDDENDTVTAIKDPDWNILNIDPLDRNVPVPKEILKVIMVATYCYNESGKTIHGHSLTPEMVCHFCEDSIRVFKKCFPASKGQVPKSRLK